MGEEDALYAVLESRALGERVQALFVAELAAKSHGAIACQHLSQHSPDRRFLEAQLAQGAQGQGQAEAKSNGEVQLLHAYRVYNRGLLRAFEGELQVLVEKCGRVGGRVGGWLAGWVRAWAAG
jgi:hypothetical protein